jgi:putative ABC transport system substrate-binding protein
MKRREFISLLGGAGAILPFAARAQQSGPIRRIGVLISGAETDPDMQARGSALPSGARKAGVVGGPQCPLRHALCGSDPARYLPLVKEMIALQPDIIAVQGTPMSVAPRRETLTIPVVFNAVSDPIGYGLVASLARPGGNITGFPLYE